MGLAWFSSRNQPRFHVFLVGVCCSVARQPQAASMCTSLFSTFPYRYTTRFYTRVHACVDVSARRPHFSTGTCSLNKRTAHALSRFHLDRSNEKRRNETTPGTAANRWKQVNRRMLGIRVILPTTVPRYMTRMFVSSAISLPFFLFFSIAIYMRPRFLRTNLFSTPIAMLFSFSPPWEGFFFKDFVNLFRATGKGTLDVKQW